MTSIAAAEDSWLIVACYGLTAFLMGLCFVPQTGAGKVNALSAQPAPTHCVVTLGATAPLAGGAADLPMEGEGKSARG
jgi:hypothetical protein